MNDNSGPWRETLRFDRLWQTQFLMTIVVVLLFVGTIALSIRISKLQEAQQRLEAAQKQP